MTSLSFSLTDDDEPPIEISARLPVQEGSESSETNEEQQTGSINQRAAKKGKLDIGKDTIVGINMTNRVGHWARLVLINIPESIGQDSTITIITIQDIRNRSLEKIGL